jgi:hypothetical protein
MARAAHGWYLRNTYVENNLVQPGKVHLKAEALDLGRIGQDIYAVGAEKDHIVPWDAAFRITQLTGGKVRFVLASSGHIAGIINPPGGKGTYYDRHRLPEAVEKEVNVTWHPNVENMVKVCDVVPINCPLHPETEHLFNDSMISKMKRGAYIVNTARGKICDRDAIVRALESGQLAGYAGDVWFPQPAPKDDLVAWRLCEACLDVEAASIMLFE